MSKLGLALGGGGARGFAHIGLLKVLEEENIKVHAISGCSMGAIIGSLYAYFGSAKRVEEFVYETLGKSEFKNLGIDKLKEYSGKEDKNYFEQFFDYIGTRLNVLKSLTHLSYFDEKLTNEFFEILPDISIEDLGIKISAVATDLLSGNKINFTEGKLRDIVKASSAIPGIFPPVEYNGYLLVDGSASDIVPAGLVKRIGADRVIAVNVIKDIHIMEKPQNVLEILYRTEDITSYHLSLLRLKEADLIITPEINGISWIDFDKVDEIISYGEEQTRKNLNKIKKLAKRNAYLLKFDNYLKTKRHTE